MDRVLIRAKTLKIPLKIILTKNLLLLVSYIAYRPIVGYIISSTGKNRMSCWAYII
jgi:hypothetical protein